MIFYSFFGDLNLPLPMKSDFTEINLSCLRDFSRIEIVEKNETKNLSPLVHVAPIEMQCFLTIVRLLINVQWG